MLKHCMIALLSLWIIMTAGSLLSSDGYSEEEANNEQVMNVVLLGLAGVFAIAWFARIREIRRKGEAFLLIERPHWRRGEAISGSIELGFVDPVDDAHVRLVHRRQGGDYLGEPFPWTRAADQTQGRQLLTFRGTVGLDAPNSSLCMLEVRTHSISGMRTLSAFQLTVHGDAVAEK